MLASLCQGSVYFILLGHNEVDNNLRVALVIYSQTSTRGFEVRWDLAFPTFYKYLSIVEKSF